MIPQTGGDKKQKCACWSEVSRGPGFDFPMSALPIRAERKEDKVRLAVVAERLLQRRLASLLAASLGNGLEGSAGVGTRRRRIGGTPDGAARSPERASLGIWVDEVLARGGLARDDAPLRA